MRLLVDLQALQNSSRTRGIGRYVHSLARALLKSQGKHDIRFLLNGLFPDYIESVIRDFADIAAPDRFFVFHTPGPTAALRPENGWRSAVGRLIYDDVVNRLDPDVLLIGSLFEGGGDNSVVHPGNDIDRHVVAVILYDLIPLLNQSRHIRTKNAKTWYFGKIAEARRADLLLAISDFSRREAIKHLPSDEDHVRFVGAAAADPFSAIDIPALKESETALSLLARHRITRPYLMHASAFDSRKNFQKLIDVFARLPAQLRDRRQLVLVCKLNPTERAQLRRTIKAFGLADDEVVLTGFVSDEELRLLYAHCELFVFPSSEEGFGLPVVEAMWCGAPVVGSSRSSVPEVVGMRDAVFDPDDAQEMLDVISRGLGDASFRNALFEHGAAHARTFSWSAVAERTMIEIGAALSRHNFGPVRQSRSSHDILRPLIEGIGNLKCWPGPSDRDLLGTALALEKNEQLSWPRSNNAGMSSSEEISVA